MELPSGASCVVCNDRTPDDARLVHADLGSYGEEVRNVHLHITPRPSRSPRGNVPFALAIDVRRPLVRARLRRPGQTDIVTPLVGRLRTRMRET